jgi:hypothetical protein
MSTIHETRGAWEANSAPTQKEGKMRIRIVQCLCPARRCIMAMTYESPEGEIEPSRTEALHNAVNLLIETGRIDICCGICGSHNFHYEDRVKFGLEEAPADVAIVEMAYSQASVDVKA